MVSIIKQEIEAIGSFIRGNSREILVVSLATLFLTLAQYHPFQPSWLSSLLYYAILPVLAIIIMHRNPLDFGLRLGKYRIWGFHVV